MKKYAIVGTGYRSLSAFAGPIKDRYNDSCEIVGLYDINPDKAAYYNKILENKYTIYSDFDEMIDKAKPDIVIVTSKDCTHHDYIIRAMQKGCDVISEKPMTTDEEKCIEIFRAQKKYGKNINISFNCRYMPYLAKIKEIINSGEIGKVLNVNYEYLLDYEHGSDYMRRWHRKMENSGGMLVHKSTHHLDIVNWWLNDSPLSVAAQGSLSFYGPTRPYSGKNCSTCTHTKECDFYLDITKSEFNKNFYDATKAKDGYLRDSCVFGNEIDIYDTMSLSVKYQSGAQLTYTLTLYNPYEGYKVSVLGDKGRIEASENYSGPETTKDRYKIKVYHKCGVINEYSFPKATGAHGGGDDRMRDFLFLNSEKADPLNQCATAIDGAKALLIGVCANKSIKEKHTVNIKEFIDKI